MYKHQVLLPASRFFASDARAYVLPKPKTPHSSMFLEHNVHANMKHNNCDVCRFFSDLDVFSKAMLRVVHNSKSLK